MLLILLLCSKVVYAQDSNQQRQLFWQARQLLLAKNYQQFGQLQEQLKNYPLYPYLSYIKIKQQLAYQNTAAIDEFLETYKDTPLADKLRTECLTAAVKRSNWSYFIHYYRPIYAPTMQCYYLHALLATNQKQAALKEIPDLWLTLNSPPAICRRVFSRWEQSGELTHKLLWQKLELAIENNNVAVIKRLGQRLPADEREQLKLWHRVHNQPILVQQSEQFDVEDKIDRKILLHGIQRLASKNPNELVETWPLLAKMYSFSEVEKQSLLSSLSISLARHADADAGTWLKLIKPQYTDSVLREWRVRN